MTIYYAAPGVRSPAPWRSFSRPLEALQFARRAAEANRTTFAVWARHGAALRILGVFRPPQVPA